MKNRLLGGVVLASLSLAACSQQDVKPVEVKKETNVQAGIKIDEKKETAVQAGITIGEKNPGAREDFRGKTEAEALAFAEKMSVPFRVVKRDGQNLPTTKDFRIGRINAEVEKGLVVDYQVEGQEKPVIEDSKPVEAPVSKAYLNLSEKAAADLAEKNGVSFRVVKRDGEFLPATMDYRPGRINAEVEKGIVVDYQVE